MSLPAFPRQNAMNIRSIYIAGKDSVVFYTAIRFILYSAHVTLLITSAFRIYDTLTVYDISTVYGTAHVDLVSAHALPESPESAPEISPKVPVTCVLVFPVSARSQPEAVPYLSCFHRFPPDMDHGSSHPASDIRHRSQKQWYPALSF